MTHPVEYTYPYTLAELLDLDGGGFSFQIPLYQRQFSWGTTEVEAYFHDLCSLRSGGNHYFGTLYFHDAGTRKLLLDGQQRLTATQQLLIVLLDLCELAHADRSAKRLDDDNAAEKDELEETERKKLDDEFDLLDQMLQEIRKLLFVGLKAASVDDLRLLAEYEGGLALKLATEKKGDRHAYCASRIAGKFEHSEFRIYLKAFDTLYGLTLGHILGLSQSELSATLEDREIGSAPSVIEYKTFPVSGGDLNVTQLNELFESLKTAPIVGMKLDSSANVHKIFETLNSRGLPLKKHEEIKNHMFAKAASSPKGPDRNKREQQLKDDWAEILGYTREDESLLELDYVILFVVLSKRNRTASYSQVVTDAKAWIEDNLDDFIGSVKAGARRLWEAKHGKFSGKPRQQLILDTFANLALLGDKYAWLPVVATAEAEIDDSLLSVYQIAEHFTFRFMKVLTGKQITPANFKTWMIDQSVELEKALDRSGPTIVLPSSAKDAFALTAQSEIPDSEFEKHFENFAPVDSKVQFYTLQKIEHVLHLRRFTPTGTLEENIEHIYPKTPVDGRRSIPDSWPHMAQYHPGSARWSKPAERTEFISRIGNLTLLESVINSKIQNAAIADKVSGYGSHPQGYVDSAVGMVEHLVRWCHRGPAVLGSFTPDLDWDETLIVERQKELSHFAPLIWTLGETQDFFTRVVFKYASLSSSDFEGCDP